MYHLFLSSLPSSSLPPSHQYEERMAIACVMNVDYIKECNYGGKIPYLLLLVNVNTTKQLELASSMTVD